MEYLVAFIYVVLMIMALIGFAVFIKKEDIDYPWSD